MGAKQPFEWRIVIAFVLLTALVSGVFSLSIVAVVHFVEEHLVSEELQRELNSVLREDIQYDRPPRLDSRTRFFATDLPQYAVPERFARLDAGFTEIVDESGAYYAYTHQSNGHRYLLVRDQHEFEAREQALFNVVLAGFLLTIAAAWGLGRFTARAIMAPVSRLARQVRDLDPTRPAVAALASDYPADEVGQLAAAFDAALGQVNRLLERERLFTSDVSHELRTPLMIVASSCELLRESSMTPRQSEQLERIERASEEMRDLVQTFLQLARGTPNAMVSDADRTLSEVAVEQAQRWRWLFQDKGLEFQYVEATPDHGHYNPTLLGAVMANLLRNALHYTERGHVRLIVESGGFRVEDSGVGIPAAEHDAVFQTFRRGQSARGEGLGLGLSLVKRIYARQGWRIFVHAGDAAGTCFRVSLSEH
ncbi:MAG: sensor histidine kinase [Thiotrichales bacterium]